MTIDDYAIIPFYNINIKLLLFYLFCLKLIHNQYNDIIKQSLPTKQNKAKANKIGGGGGSEDCKLPGVQ